MKKLYHYPAIILLLSTQLRAQQSTPTDGDWKKQYVALKNTAEADVMIRIGDIDNLGYGWQEGFNPFSGRSTDPHGYPWDVDAKDVTGTDRIFVLTGYKYNVEAPDDGYARSTTRPDNIPRPLTLPLADLKGVTIKSATLQLFVDDFQSPEFQCKFQFKLNGKRFIVAEKIINTIAQTGPVGKLITLQLTDEFLEMLEADSLVIAIDDPVTLAGDGFAVDFVKLLINPKGVLYKGNIKGIVIDANTRERIKDAEVGVGEYGSIKTNDDGRFLLEGVPAGLAVVSGSAVGYSSAQKQVDVITTETTEDVELELKPSGKVTYNTKTLREGDNLVMNNIQFELASATLLAAGKAELDKLTGFMQQNQTVEILLSGHTSTDGTVTFNKELSLKRVGTCKSYLAAKGIDEGRITIKGFGSDKPVAANDTEANRAKNRRVEMQITKL